MALTGLPPAADKRAHVRAMFDRIAPRYDRMNRLLSLGLDQRWRRVAIAAIGVGPGDVVLDLACGTGDLTELARERGARAIGADFAREMLREAVRRGVDAELVAADCAALPFPDGFATAVTCGFALRNFDSLAEILAEAQRVLARGGRIALLEVDRPKGAIARAGHSLYFDQLVPRIGALLADRAAYSYLPRSTQYLPPPPALLELIRHNGFEDVKHRSLLLGAVQLLTGVRR